MIFRAASSAAILSLRLSRNPQSNGTGTVGGLDEINASATQFPAIVAALRER